MPSLSAPFGNFSSRPAILVRSLNAKLIGHAHVHCLGFFLLLLLYMFYLDLSHCWWLESVVKTRNIEDFVS